ncbi:diphosphomevalonate decarboxylase [Microgenomates group bacterium RIFCSPLOWO2_01_FULL_47_10]|nr:MAG: diphosphomevalonate decarboxylase [Microgenomates group bacterium RIFCSPLOWO2_01_FULL_47_10]
MQKTTIKASSDVALVKYWGKKNEILRLPENGSISIKLDGLDTITTVEWDENLKQDQITIQGESEDGEVSRVIKHLDKIRTVAGKNMFAKMVSKNTFPKGTGLSSSGSGFAALTIAATKSLDLDLSEKELSILARQGSGTACRCVCGGFVEWKDGDASETSFSQTLYARDYWDVRDIVVVVDEGKKKVSSTEGHTTAQTSIAFAERQKRIGDKIVKIKQHIAEKNFKELGELVEAEALEFHSILLTSTPPMIAWYPGTVQVMLEVQAMREEDIPAYFTINTGFNVHVLTLPEYENEVKKRLEKLALVKKTIVAKVGGAPEELKEHLF